MGLFNRNGGSGIASETRNMVDVIQREHNTGTLIYLDPEVNFNTNSVIVVAPNETAIFIKNGEFYGTLPSGRHEVKTENIPFFTRLRNFFAGGQSTFTCQVYHVNNSEQTIFWGTSAPIEFGDYFLGGGDGFNSLPTKAAAAGTFQVCFNVREDDDACKQAFMRLVGDKSVFTAEDLSRAFHAQVSQKVNTIIGRSLSERSKTQSISGVSSELEPFAEELLPQLKDIFRDYGFDCVSFAFKNITIEEDESRREAMTRLRDANFLRRSGPEYMAAYQMELMKDMANNPSMAGGIAGVGAGLGMGMAAGGAFAGVAGNMFQQQPYGQPYGQPQQPPQPQAAPQQDPVEVLGKMKQMLDAGLISQEVYDAKVAEVMSRM